MAKHFWWGRQWDCGECHGFLGSMGSQIWAWRERQVNESSASEEILQLWGHQILVAFFHTGLCFISDFSKAVPLAVTVFLGIGYCQSGPSPWWWILKTSKLWKQRKKRLLAAVSRDLGMKWEQSNQQGMLDATTSTVVTQGLASCYDAESLGGPLNSPAICS